MTVGDKIKHLRKSMGLTQTELGERLGVQKNAVSKWECGRVEGIPTSTIKALAALFGVQPSYLIDDEKISPPVSGRLILEDISDEDRKTVEAILRLSQEQRLALAKLLGISE